MYPLLHRDGLDISYYAVMVVLATATLGSSASFERLEHDTGVFTWKKVAVRGSLIGMVIIHTVDAVLIPPHHLPDLFVMLFMIYSFVHFLSAFIYFNYLVIFDSSIENEFNIN